MPSFLVIPSGTSPDIEHTIVMELPIGASRPARRDRQKLKSSFPTALLLNAKSEERAEELAGCTSCFEKGISYRKPRGKRFLPFP